MKITVAQLSKASGGKPDVANMTSVVVALDKFGAKAGFDKPHRLAHFIAQLGHESGGFRYDKEIWGPTAAQKRYERNFAAAWPPTKDDSRNRLPHQLGNSVEGDGKKFAGRGPIQLTGRGNVTRFHQWCVSRGYSPPDFVADPDRINADPWEGLSAIWFWDAGNQTGKTLNRLADANDIVQLTKKINGGLNGFDDRVRLYTRTALVLLGYEPEDVAGFQAWAQTKGLLPADTDEARQVDGDAGPKTWAAMHMALADEGAPAKAGEPEVKAAPVTEEKVVPVIPPKAENTLWTRLNGVWVFLATPFAFFMDLEWPYKLGIILFVLASVGFLLFKGELIAARVKSVLKSFDDSDVVR